MSRTTFIRVTIDEKEYDRLKAIEQKAGELANGLLSSGDFYWPDLARELQALIAKKGE